MSKFLKLSIVALILMGLMAGSAFAAAKTHVDNGADNTPFVIALETLGANRDVLIAGNGGAPNVDGSLGTGAAANYPVAFTTTQNLTAQNLISVVFTGAAFNGATINICAVNGVGVGATNEHNITVATGTPAANATTFNFQLNGNGTGAGNYLVLTNSLCTSDVAVTFPVRITPTSSVGKATIAISAITAGNIPVDSASAVSIAKINQEYVAHNGASNHTVDYLFTPFNGTLLIGQTQIPPVLFAETSENDELAIGNIFDGAPNIVDTGDTGGANAFNYDTNGEGGALNAQLTVSAVANLTDSASWQGVSQVFLSENHGGGGFNGTCTDNAGGNLVGVASPSGTVALAIPTAAFNGGASGGAASEDNALCVVVNGTSTLNTRTISMSEQVLVAGTGANQQAATGFSPVDVWGLDAYQAIIPWVTNASSVPTYCLINNGNPLPASVGVTMTVLSSEGAVTGLSNVSLGTIAANQSLAIKFDNNGVTTVNSGATLASVSSMGTDDRYAAQITVAAGAPLVTMACQQTDPVTGGKRNVPVLITPGSGISSNF